MKKVYLCVACSPASSKKKLVMQFDREEVRVSIESRKRVERDYS
jgi:hypothetical protein